MASHQDLALHCNNSTYALVAQVLLCLVTSDTFSAHFRCYDEIMEIWGFSFTVLFCYMKALSFHFVWSCSKNSLWLGAVEFAVKSVQFGNIAWLTFSVHFEDALLRQHKSIGSLRHLTAILHGPWFLTKGCWKALKVKTAQSCLVSKCYCRFTDVIVRWHQGPECSLVPDIHNKCLHRLS